jgi:cytochrome c-type biogenesis protein CcmH/NrfG
LEQDPRDPIANCTLGRILRPQDKPALAVPYLQAAIAVNPRYQEALLALAQCRISLNQAAEAVPLLRQAISINPNNAEAYYIPGTALNDQAIRKRVRRSAAKLVRCALLHSNGRQSRRIRCPYGSDCMFAHESTRD